MFFVYHGDIALGYFVFTRISHFNVRFCLSTEAPVTYLSCSLLITCLYVLKLKYSISMNGNRKYLMYIELQIIEALYQ